MAETVAASESVTNEVEKQVNGGAESKEDVETTNANEVSEVKEETIKTEDDVNVAGNGTKTEDGAEVEEKDAKTKNDVDMDTTPAKVREWDVGKDESYWSREKRKRDGDHEADEDDGHYSKRNKHVQKPRQKENIKSRFDDKEQTDDHDEIRRQVEFYFSDSNLPVDKYLMQQTGGHKNQPVDLKTLTNFARMRRFQPYTEVVKALKESEFIDLETQGNEHMITRKIPLDAEYTDDLEKNEEILHRKSLPLSIYVSGFPFEERDTHSKIEEFFEVYGVRSVRLRREQDGTFKNSIFAEFESEEKREQFLALNPIPKFEGLRLSAKTKQEYIDEKYGGDIHKLVVDSRPKPASFRDKRSFDGYKNKGGKRHGGGGARDENGDRRERRNGRDGGRGRYDDGEHEGRERRGFKRQGRDHRDRRDGRRDGRKDREDREGSRDREDRRSHGKRKDRDEDERDADEGTKKTKVEEDKKRKHREDAEEDTVEGAKKAKLAQDEEVKEVVKEAKPEPAEA